MGQKMPNKKRGTLAVTVFFLCGFSTALNVILIPYLQNILQLQYTPITLIQVSFFLAYFLISPLSGMMFEKRPLLEGIRFGLLKGMIGTFIIYLASATSSYTLILVGIFVLGSGIATLQVTTNLYIMRIGPKKNIGSRLTLAQASTSFGAIIAPYIGSLSLLPALQSLTFSSQGMLHTLYFFLSATWGIALLYTFLGELPNEKPEELYTAKTQEDDLHPLKVPSVLFGMIAIGIAIGIEISVSCYLLKFLSSGEIPGVSVAIAGKCLMLFWFAVFSGRLWGSRLLEKIPAGRLFFYHALSGFTLTAIALTCSGWITTIAIILLGYCLSIMFPIIFTIVLERIPSDNQGSIAGFLCMANIGGALFPLLQGVTADTIGLHYSFFLPLMGFLYLSVYSQYLQRRESVKGFSHLPRKKRR